MKKRLFPVVLFLLLNTAFAEVESIYLGPDSSGRLIQAERLTPGYEFLCPVMANVRSIGTVPVTGEDLEKGYIQVRILSGGSCLEAVSLKEKGGQVYLSLIPRTTGGIREQQASIRLRYHSPEGAAVSEIPLRLGYQTASAANPLELAPGEAYPVSASAPLVTAELFQALSEANGFAESTLTGAGWSFTGQMTGMETQNLAVSHAPIEKVVRKNPAAQMEFTSFPGLPDFEMKGTLSLDAGELKDRGEQIYLYRYAYGNLYPLTFEYDSSSGAVVFHPSQLSCYILSDVPLENP